MRYTECWGLETYTVIKAQLVVCVQLDIVGLSSILGTVSKFLEMSQETFVKQILNFECSECVSVSCVHSSCRNMMQLFYLYHF